MLTTIDLGGGAWTVKVNGHFETDRTRSDEYHATLVASRPDGTRVPLLMGGDGSIVYILEPTRAKRLLRR